MDGGRPGSTRTDTLLPYPTIFRSSRSTEGSSLSSSAVLSTLRAVRQTASLPTTSWCTIARQSGASVSPGSSLMVVNLMNSVGAGRVEAQRADALGGFVQRRPLLGVLVHEHRVQRVEHRQLGS